MNKIYCIVFSFALIIGMGACKKINPTKDGTSPVYVPSPGTGGNGGGNGGGSTNNDLADVGSLPTDFTKKAILYEFTGEWCGWCPEGAKIMNDEIANNPNKVIGIAIHDGDPMEVTSYNDYMKTLTGVGGFPNGSIDLGDAVGRGQWSGQIATSLAEVADCGLAIVTKKVGSLYNIKVFVGYKVTNLADTRLSVLVTENDVPQSSPGAQGNYSSSVVVDPNTWVHTHVYRGAVSDEKGDVIDMTKSAKYTIVEYNNVDLSGMKIQNMDKVSIVAKINKNTNPRDVYNSQEVKLGSTKKWD